MRALKVSSSRGQEIKAPGGGGLPVGHAGDAGGGALAGQAAEFQVPVHLHFAHQRQLLRPELALPRGAEAAVLPILRGFLGRLVLAPSRGPRLFPYLGGAALFYHPG